jgi:hypothetical protein
MNLAIENHPKIKLRLHIIIGVLLFLNFVLIIARIADKGTPKTRSNTWGIVVVSVPLFLLRLDRDPEQLVAAQRLTRDVELFSASRPPSSWLTRLSRLM